MLTVMEDRATVSGSTLDDLTIAGAIDVLGLGVDVAEFHGGICGLLCASGPGAAALWIRQSDGGETPVTGEAETAREQLHEAEAETWRLLNSPEFEFEPLLPPVEADLAERVSALALWCQGFLTGLGLGGVRAEDLDTGDDDGRRNATIAEIVADFVEISRAHVGSEDLADADRADFDLVEIIEYVRVGTQLVFEELRRRQPLRAVGAQSRETH
ncbi:MAG: UPF0149 family protein [Gammaproteobacteria bacterium]|nr:UPF0149 family protein [Gammaproteobacteria bacterium]